MPKAGLYPTRRVALIESRRLNKKKGLPKTKVVKTSAYTIKWGK